MPHPTFDNLPQDKRQRLVAALKTEFARYSFDGASVDRITQRAGVSKGSFYQYFLDKQDAYLVAVQDSLERRVAMTDDLGDDASFAERLKSVVLDTQTFQLADPLSWEVLVRANSSDAVAVMAAIRNTGDQVHAWVCDAVRAGVAGGELHPDLDPDAAAWLVEHTVMGLGKYLLTRFGIPSARELADADAQTREDLQQTVCAVLDMVLRAVGCEEQK